MLKETILKIMMLLLALSSIYSINAQQAGLNFSLAFPQGEFGEQVDKVGYGLGGEFMFISPSQASPFGLGVNVGYYIYGRESRREPWSYTIPDVFVDVDRTNNLLNFHLVLELGLPAGRVRPYLQGLFGGTYLFTKTSVSGEYNQDNIASSTNYYDWAWSFGGGGGISILLTGNPETETGAIFLDFKGRYLLGTRATYLKEGDVSISGIRVTYRPSKSQTDILTFHLGVRVSLNVW